MNIVYVKVKYSPVAAYCYIPRILPQPCASLTSNKMPNTVIFEAPLSQGFGYGIVLGLGFAFALLMIFITWALKR
mgnify:FL=1